MRARRMLNVSLRARASWLVTSARAGRSSCPCPRASWLVMSASARGARRARARGGLMLPQAARMAQGPAAAWGGRAGPAHSGQHAGHCTSLTDQGGARPPVRRSSRCRAPGQLGQHARRSRDCRLPKSTQRLRCWDPDKHNASGARAQERGAGRARGAHLNFFRNSLSRMPDVYSPRSIMSGRRIALGTVASISASRLSKPVTATISATSVGVPLLCRGAKLPRGRKNGVRRAVVARAGCSRGAAPGVGIGWPAGAQCYNSR
jgi:hypothetical protein